MLVLFTIGLSICCLTIDMSLVPKLDKKDIAGARFILYSLVNGKALDVLEWSDIPDDEKNIIITWLQDMPKYGILTFNTYAPELLISKRQEFSINIQNDSIIVNFNTRFLGIQSQVIRNKTETDQMIYSLLEQRIRKTGKMRQ